VRVVLDTNVVISAYLFPSSGPARILELWGAGTLELIVSEQLISEYERVLRYDHIRPRLGLNDAALSRSTARFHREGTLVDPGSPPRVVKNDPDDDVIIATAIAGEADYIVSGDRHLLELGEHRGIRIIPPAMLLVLLETDL
jgi:uncharacterized protein